MGLDALGVRRRAAVALGRVAGSMSRALGLGAGESVVGKVALAVDPELIGALASRLRDGTVAVCGTNGKTSTAAMIVRVLERSGRRVIANATGANLASGVTTALLAGGRADVAVLEIDEAAARRISPVIRPRAMVWTNVLRDQLDRYTEVDVVLDHLVAAAAGLRPEATLVCNADDPGLAGAAERTGVRTVYYGLARGREASSTLASDFGHCPRCSTRLRYAFVTVGHLGDYTCPSCGWSRPPVDVRVTPLELCGVRGVSLLIETPEGGAELRLEVGGLSTASNAGAAVAAARAMGISIESAAQALQGMQPLFGRGERIRVAGDEGVLLLMKNAAGANELVLELLEEETSHLVVAVNDLAADGKDVSWLWDVEFERLGGKVDVLVASGRRASDIAVRLKYAGLDVDLVETDLGRAVRFVAGRGHPFAVLATYTAMLGVRELFHGRSGRVRSG